MASVEVRGLAVVGVGSFNPAILHPRWLAEKGLITAGAADEALAAIVLTPQLCTFTADWLSVQVTTEQIVFHTVDEARSPDLRDVAVGCFELLPETPVDALGINSDVHFRCESEEHWHKLGDMFAPKDYWNPLFEGASWKQRGDGVTSVGLRSITVEAYPTGFEGWVRVEIAPSVRVPVLGVYIGINGHFQLTVSAEQRRGNGLLAAETIVTHWDEVNATEAGLVDMIMGAA